MNERGTWRWSSGLANWNYRPLSSGSGRESTNPPETSELRKRWLSGLLVRLPDLLGDFAFATKVEVATLSQGDGTCVLDLREPGASDALQAFLSRTEEVVGVTVDLTLRCEDQERRPFDLEHGALLWINIRLTESGTLDPASDAPIYLRVQLNVDIYAPKSWGWERDNTGLAARNGPRLAAFLERIERDVPAALLEIDAEDYRGMIGPRGFLSPAGAPRAQLPAKP